MIEAKDFSERKTGQERWGGQSLVKENAPGKGLGKKQEAVQETLPEPEEAQEDENPCWYHICSQGLEGVDLFPDENAFIVGVNKFAVAFKLFGEEVEVAILVLVSNHFHSLVWGRKSDVIRCAERYKKTISMYYSHRFGTSKVMCRVRVKVERVDSEEYLKNVIGYILNNPRKHRETNNPFSYPWSSILEYFDKEGHSAVCGHSSMEETEGYGNKPQCPSSMETLRQWDGYIRIFYFIRSPGVGCQDNRLSLLPGEQGGFECQSGRGNPIPE